MYREVGVGLVVTGLILFVLPYNIFGLVTVVVDTTAPQLLSTSPAPSTSLPSITQFSAVWFDPDDGITSSWVVPSWAPSTKIQLQSDTFDYNLWSATITDPKLASGTYQLTWYAMDTSGNTNIGEVTVIFVTPAGQLKGTWYINDTPISSSSVTYKAATDTLKFSFKKDTSSTVSDSDIAVVIGCDYRKTVAKSGCGGITGPQNLVITDSTTHTWATSLKFQPGTYSLDLKATVPSNPQAGSVILSIAGTIGGSPFNLSYQQIAGLIMSLAGALFIVKGRDE